MASVDIGVAPALTLLYQWIARRLRMRAHQPQAIGVGHASTHLISTRVSIDAARATP
jgi:hypothetical protein